MKLCRFTAAGSADARVGLITPEEAILDLTDAGVRRLGDLLALDHLPEQLRRYHETGLRTHPLTAIRLLTPVESQEVWAAGVTYLRSKQARMEESDFSADAYDRVYEAARPEIFFKSMPDKVVSPGDAVGIRRDARWNVPEPELALVVNPAGRIAGFTIGNDMSSRDIEGENLLYLPQAKIYARSCAVGPCIAVGFTEEEAREWTIELAIVRDGRIEFSGETRAARITRTFTDLVEYLFRSQTFPNGAVLLTGAGIVPPDSFTLAAGDVVRISISGIGTLENTVTAV
jgi:2-dehydro-3-deoxy-D-arabinonate dehydratase